jgi:hypothetical protein
MSSVFPLGSQSLKYLLSDSLKEKLANSHPGRCRTLKLPDNDQKGQHSEWHEYSSIQVLEFGNYDLELWVS